MNFNTDKFIKVLGPPGTGKTTYLLNIVEELIEKGTDPRKICFTTFSRSGAYEARNRAIEKFGFIESKFPYFRTLHSICYRTRGFEELLNWRDYLELGKQLGVSFTLAFEKPEALEDQQRFFTKGDKLLHWYALSRATGKSFQEVYNAEIDNNISFPELKHFAASLLQYKELHGKIDFTDMLENFVKESPQIDIDYLIVDEAQDLSNLQWQSIQVLYKRTQACWIAGDDDQCIHEWNGASSNFFISFPCSTTHLSQSYRLPLNAKLLSESITEQITARLEKKFLPKKGGKGTVSYIGIENIPFLKHGKEQWLLLTRNRAFFEDYKIACLTAGVRYTLSAFSSDKINQRLSPVDVKSQCCYWWEEILKGGQISGLKAKEIYKVLGKGRVKHGYKKKISQLDESEIITIDRLMDEFGLLFNEPWRETFSNALTEGEKKYIEKLEETGELGKPPRVEISTIHNAKGREAENVVVMPDMSYKTWQSFSTGGNPDEEHRVWYVAITRTMNRLFITHPISDRYYQFSDVE